MTATKKKLSYSRLKSEMYFGGHFSERMSDNMSVTAHVDEVLTAYCDAVTQGFPFPEAETMASEMLYHDLHFSKYDTLVSVLEQKFEKELPSPFPERLAPILLNNKVVQAVSAKYELTDDFAAGTEYDKLYTELTGTIVLLIEISGLPTIGGENTTWHFIIGGFCSVKSQDKRSTSYVKSSVNTCLRVVKASRYRS